MKSLHVDVLVIGAGLSGIDLACRLTTMAPEHTFAVLESREATGGTWDLFRYPGIRSDSDMYTLSFPFRPWTHPRSIADGDSILGYLRDTVREFGIEDRIHLGQRVIAASWSSTTQRWSVRAETVEGLVEHTASFLYLATGYYDYDRGHVAELPGASDFAGPTVHPQFWPPDLDVTGKRVVVIGSGATAVTLVPALVDEGAAHVTMLQRSPTWMVSLPGSDRAARAAFGLLPARIAHRLVRAKNIGFNVGSYQLARRFPRAAAAVLTSGVRRALPEGYAVQPHFAPRYAPWDQRLCVVPDSDFFDAISSGRADILTDTIEVVEADGIRTTGGQHLAADVLVTATGLRMTAAGNIPLDVDGTPVRINEGHVYKGLMLSGVPNLAWCVGYINNSWTLRADLSAKWTCRLLTHLREHGLATVTPRYDPGVDDTTQDRPIIDMSSGYIQRAAASLPKQGNRAPWVLRQNYLRDLAQMSGRRFDDGHLEFGRSREASQP